MIKPTKLWLAELLFNSPTPSHFESITKSETSEEERKNVFHNGKHLTAFIFPIIQLSLMQLQAGADSPC